MKLAHSIRLSVFIKPEDIAQDLEIEKKVMNCLKSLLPFDLEAEKIKIEKEVVVGFNNRNISILKLELVKESHTSMFIKNLLTKLNHDQRSLLLRQAESRLDENLDFFIRLGKDELLRGNYYITETGECFHIRIGIAAFPKKREAALEIIEQIFS